MPDDSMLPDGAVTLNNIDCEEERLVDMEFQFVGIGDRLDWSKS